ncbi:SDR family oxidoreductase [Pendulispora rubella]|uniref:SDR family oxidoreductase n=1 Tax=Pendulispora rubella TaxID=2741070 RepID=A0ABZ2KRZ7_9BACT
MRVFVTGASGFIGSAVVPELISAGHHVVGLARSEASAAALRAAGAEVLRGDLEDLDSLRAGAAASDGVIHLAFIHDFSQFEASARTDHRAIEALGGALEGSGKPLVVAGGLLGIAPGRVATERDEHGPDSFVSPRQAGVRAALSFASRGVRSSIVRLAPSVHGPNDRGFLAMLIDIARTKGVAGYVGEGTARWPGVHRLDAGRLFRLGLEKAPAGSFLHGAADEGVRVRAIAEVIGRHLNLPVAPIGPENAGEHFGWFAPLLGMDSPASNALTRELLDWNPTHPGLLEDLDAGHYFEPLAN